MGIMVVVMIAFFALAPSHMGLGGSHQHGQGNAASQPAEPRMAQDAGASSGTEPSGHPR